MYKIILGLVLGFAIVAGGAIAGSAPTKVRQNGMSFGPYCISASTGLMRSVATAKKCHMGEVRVLHSQGSGIGGAGAVGVIGAAGHAGAKGDTGATGAPGAKGETGATGAAGAKGDTGATGAAGAKGDTGATGERGDTGPQGAPGVKAVVAVTSGEGCKFGGWKITFGDATAAEICNGAPGHDGAAGPQGPKGENGKDGAPGQNGGPGEKGAPGLSAYQSWLDDGHTGTVGDYQKWLKGETGDSGPKGDKGEKGDRGDTGPQGPPVSVTTATICVNNSNSNITWGGAGSQSCNPNETVYHVAVLP